MSSNSASDVITYIGVPLAVLGVLPILYNTIATLAALSRIRRMLRHSRLTALTRSDVVNRVIEVELPRYAAAPWDRHADREEYWTLCRHPSSIPGGSWTTFNWRTNAIGIKTQRVEYADQLRQPQVEVEFDQLIAYLLDLGAVPDPHGWRVLRSTGLWTPVGCALMMSPDGRHRALTVAPLDDSDGNLSLAVNWSYTWTTRNHTSLPPYWVRLPAPLPDLEPVASREEEPEKDVSGSVPSGESDGTATSGAAEAEVVSKEEEGKAEEGERPVSPAAKSIMSAKSGKPRSVDTVQREIDANPSRAIVCHISGQGLVDALPQDPNPASRPEHLYIDHLRSRPTAYPAGPSRAPHAPPRSSVPTSVWRDYSSSPNTSITPDVWFASAITAYGTTSETILWNYRIPDGVIAFARRESVPCGVLEMLSVVGADDTPEWTSNGGADMQREAMDISFRRMREQRAAMERESRMPPGERMAAARERMIQEQQQRMDDFQDRNRRNLQLREARLLDALQSAKWTASHVARHTLPYLLTRTPPVLPRLPPAKISPQPSPPPSSSTSPNQELPALRDAVGAILHRMVRDGQFAEEICGMLDRWRAWAENAGMRKADFDDMKSKLDVFAQASLVVAVISGTVDDVKGALAADLQECLRMWRVVRLG